MSLHVATEWQSLAVILTEDWDFKGYWILTKQVPSNLADKLW